MLNIENKLRSMRMKLLEIGKEIKNAFDKFDKEFTEEGKKTKK